MFPLDADHSAPTLGGPEFSLIAIGVETRVQRPLKLKDSDLSPVDGSDIRALTGAVRIGDANAFSRFYDLYSFRIYRFVLVLAGGDENTAREVCQAAFIKVAKRLEVFDTERALWAWLCTLARNTFIDCCRAEQRRNRLVPIEELPPAVTSEAESTNQLSELLRDALTALPPGERELLQAVYVDGRPLQELADASGQTYKAVESRLARLRQKLKKQLLQNMRHEQEP
jgi:RNA polymerase sigma-70 factor (ECF subfamily)